MSHCPGHTRFLTILMVLNVLSALTIAHAQQSTSFSAELAPGLTLFFETAPFIESEHEVTRDESGRLVINGCEQIFGVDGTIPTQYLREAYVVLEGQRHALDTSCMFSGMGELHQVSPNPGGAGYQLESSLSDGAGTYYATWFITPMGTARTRIVSAAEAMRAEREMVSGFNAIVDELGALMRKLEEDTATPADAESIIVMVEEETDRHLRQIAGETRSSNNGPERIIPMNISWMQDKLNELDYDCGPVDGLMGSKTRSCIRLYQEDNGLNTTGRLDEATTAALRKLK